MLKIIYCLLSIICIGISFSSNETVYANQNNPPSLEEMHTKIGYKSVEKALKEFENHVKQDVKLPTIKPSIPFTHQFGRFTEDKKYDINDTLEIQFLNEKSSGNHYKVDIRPLKSKLVFKNKGNQQVYTLQNGQKAIYMVDRLFNFLVFEKDNCQYMLGIDKKVSNKVSPEILVQIANSIE